MPTVDEITGAKEPNRLLESSVTPITRKPLLGVLHLETDHGLIRIAMNRGGAEELINALINWFDPEVTWPPSTSKQEH